MARPLILIVGETGAGKSSSLENIPNQEKWAYFNCDAGKEIPYPNNFQERVITNPKDIPLSLKAISEKNIPLDGVVIDTMTFMMEMFRSQYVAKSEDGFGAWEDYGEFFRNLLQTDLAQFPGAAILLAHTETLFDKEAKAKVTRVPVAGALAKNGIEAYFTTVISAKKIAIDKLTPYQNDLLNITEDEKIVGIKHVFQTRITADTLGERIRSPKNLWSIKQTYIDNDINQVIKHMEAFYNKGKK